MLVTISFRFYATEVVNTVDEALARRRGVAGRNPQRESASEYADARDLAASSLAQTIASAVFVSAAQSMSRPSPGPAGTVMAPATIGSSFRDLSPFMCSVE